MFTIKTLVLTKLPFLNLSWSWKSLKQLKDNLKRGQIMAGLYATLLDISRLQTKSMEMALTHRLNAFKSFFFAK